MPGSNEIPPSSLGSGPRAGSAGAASYDPGAVHAKYLAEREKRMVPGRTAIRDLRTDEHFARYRDDPFRPVVHARPGRRRGRRRDRGRGDRRGRRRRPAPQGRRRADPHRRRGGRYRGHLVLEPLSGCDVRRRVVHLHPHARGARLHPHPALRVRRRDPGLPREDRRPVRPRVRRPVPHRGDSRRVGRGHGSLADPHQPRRRGHLPLVRPGRRDPQPHEAARHPGHGGLRRPLLPHGALGLRVHRRRGARAPHRLGGQVRRSHRRRGERHPVPAAARRGGEARLRVPAHAVGRRRARQPAHRSRLRPGAQTGLAARPNGQLPGDHARSAGRGRPGRRRVDAPLGCRSPPPAAQGHDERGVPSQWRGGRLRDHGGAPAPDRGAGSGPGQGRGPQAALPVPLQAAVLPRRVPSGVQPRQRHASSTVPPGSSGSPSRARLSTAISTRSTASSTAPASSRSSPPCLVGPATRSSVAAVSLSPRSGPTAPPACSE